MFPELAEFSLRGHDAVDVAINTTLDPNTLVSFKVICDEVPQPN